MVHPDNINLYILSCTIGTPSSHVVLSVLASSGAKAPQNLNAATKLELYSYSLVWYLSPLASECAWIKFQGMCALIGKSSCTQWDHNPPWMANILLIILSKRRRSLIGAVLIGPQFPYKRAVQCLWVADDYKQLTSILPHDMKCMEEILYHSETCIKWPRVGPKKVAS